MHTLINKNQFLYILLTLFTYLIWLTNELSAILAFIVYPVIFIYLVIKKEPFNKLLIVLLFGNMAIRVHTGIFKLDYILIYGLFLYTVYHIIKNRTFRVGQLLIPLVVYGLYNVLSLIWTPVLITGYRGIVAISEGYLMYICVTNNRFNFTKDTFKEISKLASFILLTLTLEIITLYFANGWGHMFGEKGDLRLGWGFSNLVAVIYVFLIPLLIYKYYDFRKNIRYIFIDSLSVFGLVLTMSRGAMLGVIVGLAVLILMTKTRITRFISPFIVGGVLAFLVIRITDSTFLSEVFDQLFDTTGRLPLYKLAWEKFLEKPLLGHGIKSSKYFINTVLGRPETYYHNFILQILSTLGIIGISIFGVIVYKWVKILSRSKELFLKLITVSVIGALIHQLLDVSFDLHFFGVYFYLLIGLVEVYKNNVGNKLIKEYTWRNNNLETLEAVE